MPGNRHLATHFQPAIIVRECHFLPVIVSQTAITFDDKRFGSTSRLYPVELH